MTNQQLQGAERAFQLLNFWKVDAVDFIEFYENRVKETNEYQKFIEAEHAKLKTPTKTEPEKEVVEIKTDTKTKR